MKKYIAMRAVSLAKYILLKNDTVRGVAKKHKIGKSTVYKDITERLSEINPILYNEVLALLKINKQERYARGGSATRNKYKNIKEKLKLNT